MDPRFPLISREEFQSLQMDLRQVIQVQGSHTERISRLERRHAEDAAIKSVWQSPFPGVLGATPQQGPLPVPSSDIFGDLDEHSTQLLNSLHLGAAEDEPVRRGGAASRANSVRFDESALQGSGWAGQSRHSGDFGPIRPGSSLMMERSLSHKSDGRHSSAGHSVHSMHSLPSGRASSLGIDANLAAGSRGDDSPLDVPEPPPGFYAMGSVPSIVRCWLTTQFAHETLLYADLCTGSQKSTLDASLVEDLKLHDGLERDLDGTYRITIPVYLAEAIVTQANTRSTSPAHQIPSITAVFEVLGMEQAETGKGSKGIRIFIGSDALRAHSADVLLSQNRVVLYSNDRDKLSVPFVRPEDDGIFKYICTAHVQPERPRLNAEATPFVSNDGKGKTSVGQDASNNGPRLLDMQPEELERQEVLSPTTTSESTKATVASIPSESGESEKNAREASGSESGGKDAGGNTAHSATGEGTRRESASGIWGSWRQGNPPNGAEFGQRESGLSGYQPAIRGSRGMKVLKPQRSTSSARPGASYDPPAPRNSGELRRKSQVGTAENGTSGVIRWESKRATSVGTEAKPPHQAQAQAQVRESPRSVQNNMPRAPNPVGGASAFSWMNAGGKAKPSAAAAE